MKFRLIITSLILFAIALTFNVLFTRISLDKLYVDSFISQYTVIGKDLQRNLERGVHYGKPITQFVGIEKLLTATKNGILTKSNEYDNIAGTPVPMLVEDDISVHVILPDGNTIYSTNDEFKNVELGALDQLKKKDAANKKHESSQCEYVKYKNKYVILLPIEGIEQNAIANVTISLKENQIKKFLENVSAGNKIPIISISVLGIFLLTTFLYVLMPSEASIHNLSKKKIYLVIFLVISTAQILTSGLSTYAFKEHFIQVNKKNAEKINAIMKNDIEFLIGNGIRVNKLNGLDGYLKEVISAVPEIQDITLFDHHNQPLYRATKNKITDFQRSSDAYAEWVEAKKPLPDPDYNSQVYIVSGNREKGFISTNTSKEILFSRLFDTLMDSGAVIVISILFFVELLILVFKYIERQADELDEQKSPHFSVMRPAAFLFLFGIDISISFLPLHMETLYVPILSLSKDTIMGLPISVEFMFVGISILISGIWLDRRGWHEPFLSGVVLAALGILYSWLAPDAVHFIISRAIVGLGYGLSLMASQGFVITYSDWKSKAQGLAHLFAGIYAGSICGGATGAMLAEWLGYTPVFLFGAFILLLVVLYTVIFMRDGMKKPAVPTGYEGEALLKGRPIVDFLTNRTILSLVLLSSLPAAIVVVGFLNYFSPIYLNRIGASQSTIGQVMMIYGICLIYFGPFISRYVDVSRHKRIYVFFGCALGSFALLTFYFLEGYAAAIIAVVLLGFSSSFVLASQSAYTLELKVTQELGEGKAIGIFRSTSRVGQMLGPIVFSSIVLATNSRTGITYLGLVYLLTAVLFLVFTTKNRARRNFTGKMLEAPAAPRSRFSLLFLVVPISVLLALGLLWRNHPGFRSTSNNSGDLKPKTVHGSISGSKPEVGLPSASQTAEQVGAMPVSEANLTPEFSETAVNKPVASVPTTQLKSLQSNLPEEGSPALESAPPPFKVSVKPTRASEPVASQAEPTTQQSKPPEEGSRGSEPASPPFKAAAKPSRAAEPVASQPELDRFYKTRAFFANIRSRPDSDAAVLQKIPRGTKLRATGIEGDWLKLKLRNGGTGWIYSSLVQAYREPEEKPLNAPGDLSGPVRTSAQPNVPEQATLEKEIQSSLRSVLKICQVLPPVARIRSRPDVHSPVLQRLRRGTRLLVVGADGDWLKVELGNGGIGWIYHSLVQKVDRRPLPAM